jgi:hypothetical protein
MGKIINIKERQDADLRSILKRVSALIKQHQYAQLDDVGETGRGTWMIQVSSPYHLADLLGGIITAHPTARLVETKEHPGSYDWASGVYVKDCSTVEFRL